MTTTFETAERGDKVYDLLNQWGEVIDNLPMMEYPVLVRFGNVIKSYTHHGKLYDSPYEQQVLFWGKVDFNIPTKPLPKERKDNNYVKDFISEERNNARYTYHQ